MNVANTTTVAIAFGAMWRTIARPFPPPIARTAWTYSRTLSDNDSPRIRRPAPSQLKEAIRSTIAAGPGV